MRFLVSVVTLALATLALAAPVLAQNTAAHSPLGRWRTLDDQTGRAMTIVEIYQAPDATLAARIVENIAAPATCSRCSGDNKDKPIVGMHVLQGLRLHNGVWGGGQGLKPSTGDTFSVRSIELLENGRRLKVTGCRGRVFCRSAEWVRE